MSVELLQEKFFCFRQFHSTEIETFLPYCEWLSAPVGKTLWSEGYGENYAAFILKGKIGIKKQTDFNGSVVIGIYTAGSAIGELCLLTNKPRTVSAEVLEAAEMMVLHSYKLEEMIEDHPKMGLRLLREIFLRTSNRLTKSYERMASIF